MYLLIQPTGPLSTKHGVNHSFSRGDFRLAQITSASARRIAAQPTIIAGTMINASLSNSSMRLSASKPMLKHRVVNVGPRLCSPFVLVVGDELPMDSRQII